jgi:hypothetical protein
MVYLTKHSPPSSAVVMNGGAIPPLTHVSMEWCLIKPMNNFTFLKKLSLALTFCTESQTEGYSYFPTGKYHNS